jgi:hypothetical protein
VYCCGKTDAESSMKNRKNRFYFKDAVYFEHDQKKKLPLMDRNTRPGYLPLQWMEIKPG